MQEAISMRARVSELERECSKARELSGALNSAKHEASENDSTTAQERTEAQEQIAQSKREITSLSVRVVELELALQAAKQRFGESMV